MAKVKLKEWCRSNDSQNVNSDYSPNITPAINSMLTCKSLFFFKEKFNYIQNPFKC